MICFFSNLLVSYLCTVALWPYGHINENADCLAKGRLWFLSPPQNKQQKPVLDQLFRVSSPHSNSPYGQDIKLRNSNIYLIGWWYHHVNLRLFFKTLYFKRNFFGKKRFTPKNTKIDVPIFTPGGRRILGGMLSPPPSHPGCFTHLTGTASKASVSLSPPSSAFEKNLVFYTPKMGEEIC